MIQLRTISDSSKFLDIDIEQYCKKTCSSKYHYAKKFNKLSPGEKSLAKGAEIQTKTEIAAIKQKGKPNSIHSSI